MRQTIIILDYGSQFTQLIARRIREIGIYSEVYPGNIDITALKKKLMHNLCGIILSGSHASIYKRNTLSVQAEIFKLNIPILGICYGMHAMVNQFGGQVNSAKQCEFGYAEACLHGNAKLFRNISDYTTKLGQNFLKVWMSHSDIVSKLPKKFDVIASTSSCPIAAIANEDQRFYAVQFHPEVTHTLQGKNILSRFVKDICCCTENWDIPDFTNEIIFNVRKKVNNDRVILGLSGGLDSTVTAALLDKAIGSQLICIFIDNGLLRLNESKLVIEFFKKNTNIKVVYINAKEQFMKKLTNISNPEKKRKIIGHEFVKIFQNQARSYKNVKWLAQGTIYPDVIESISSNLESGKSSAIKSHHNVGGLPSSLRLKLLEPLRHFFKDEVKTLGLSLGIASKIIQRHPFPGPGLGVRILGKITNKFVRLLQHADAIFLEELHTTIDLNSGLSWYELVSQAFAVFVPIKSVGVMGDKRSYEYVIALRAIQTSDFMSANWAPLPQILLEKVSSRIINEVKGINRVVYDISNKPPATIEWE